MNYIQRAKEELSKHIDVEDDLLELYALLVLTKGQGTTMEDIHDAWSIWTNKTNLEHRSLVPFEKLPPEVQEYDREYMDAVHKAAYAFKK